MLWRKFDPSKCIKEISMLEVVLSASRSRLDVAMSIRRDRRVYLEYFYKVSIPSAMVGLPLTPLTMSNMFINDTFIAIRKALKKLRRILKDLVRQRLVDPSTANALMKSLDGVEEKMKVADSLPIEKGVEELKSCIDEVLAICSEIKGVLNAVSYGYL